MSTWEIESSDRALRADGGARRHAPREQPPFAPYWREFNDRRGNGAQAFGQRLSRARLLYLRRDENGANWLALSLLAAAVALPSLFPREMSHPAEFLGVEALPAGDTSRHAANLATPLESTTGQVTHV